MLPCQPFMLQAVCCRVDQCRLWRLQVWEPCRLGQAAMLLSLAEQYLVASAAPSLPTQLWSALAAPMESLERALIACGSAPAWPREAAGAMRAILRLRTALLQRCQVLHLLLCCMASYVPAFCKKQPCDSLVSRRTIALLAPSCQMKHSQA